jgi:flagellar biogenesis protein FliO
MPLMERIFYFIGRMLFPKQQDWQQTRSAKTLVFVLAFSLIIGYVMMKVIRLYYSHER